MGEIDVKIKTFKGVNQAIDKQQLPLDYAYDAQNCKVEDGVLQSSDGDAVYSASPLPSSIKSLMVHYSGQTGTLLAATGGKIYKLSGGVWTEIASGFTSDVFDYVNYQIDLTEIVIFTNGVDPVKVWDGTTIRDLKKEGKASAVSTDNKAPKAPRIEFHKERIWLGDETSLYFATPYDPDDFTVPTDEVEANQHGGQIPMPTWDGGVLLAIKNLYDTIMIFKTKNVFRLFGSYPGNYEIVTVFQSINGQILENSIASLENTVYWASTEGIHEFNGTSTENLTPLIKEVWKGLNKSKMSISSGIMHKGRYILAMPEGTSEVNNVVFEYDIVNRTMMVKRGMGINDFIEFEGKLLYSAPDGNVYEYGIGDTYHGTPISSYYTTGVTTGGTQKEKKYLSGCHFVASGTGKIRISSIGAITTSVEQELTSEEKMYHMKLKNKGYTLQFKIENVNGSRFKLKPIDFDVTVQD